jgi:hypothetical protein
MSDISFRLTFSPIRDQERSFTHLMSAIERPVSSPSVDPSLRAEFGSILSDLSTKFYPESEEEFWVVWEQLTAFLHNLAERPALSYGSRRLEELNESIRQVIKELGVPTQKGCCQQLARAFHAIEERVQEVIHGTLDELEKIEELEGLRKPIRQFRNALSSTYLPCFAFTWAQANKNGSPKAVLENLLSDCTNMISDLRKLRSFMQGIDDQLARTRRVIEIIIHDPATFARSENVPSNSPGTKPLWRTRQPEVRRASSRCSSRREKHAVLSPMRAIDDDEPESGVSGPHQRLLRLADIPPLEKPDLSRLRQMYRLRLIRHPETWSHIESVLTSWADLLYAQ